jgi:hypothetical protein
MVAAGFFPEDDSQSKLLHKLAERLSGVANSGHQWTEMLFGKLSDTTHSAHTAAWALLPVCLALFIIHEQARATREGSALSVTEILGKTLVIFILLLGYGSVCSLIIGLAQFGGNWMTSDNLVDTLKQTVGTLFYAAQKADFSFSEIGKFILLEFVIFVALLSCLFAYVCGLLLHLVQNVYLVILLAVGKMCISVSLVPGISLGKSWARSLAQVAAWSTVAGVITKLLCYRSFAQLDQAMGQGVGLEAVHVLPMLKLSAEFIILGLCMLAVPVIVSRIFSGAAPVGSTLGAAVTAGLALGYGKKLWGKATGAGEKARAGMGSGADAQDGAGGLGRMHKVPWYQRALGTPHFRQLDIGGKQMDGMAAEKARYEKMDAAREKGSEDDRTFEGEPTTEEPHAEAEAAALAAASPGPVLAAGRAHAQPVAPRFAAPGATARPDGAHVADRGSGSSAPPVASGFAPRAAVATAGPAAPAAAVSPAAPRAGAVAAPPPGPTARDDVGNQRMFAAPVEGGRGMRRSRRPPDSAGPSAREDVGNQRMFATPVEGGDGMRRSRRPPDRTIVEPPRSLRDGFADEGSR